MTLIHGDFLDPDTQASIESQRKQSGDALLAGIEKLVKNFELKFNEMYALSRSPPTWDDFQKTEEWGLLKKKLKPLDHEVAMMKSLWEKMIEEKSPST